MNNIEIYKPIKGFENYEVSSNGNIISYCRKKPKTLKMFTDKDGYEKCTLYSQNKKQICVLLHRIVAQSFPEICGEMFDGCVVEHINCNPYDNRAENLRVCTQKENCNNPISLVRYSKSKKGLNTKSVNQYDKNHIFIKTWESLTDASEKLKISKGHISKCCKHKRLTAGNFIWEYA